MVQLHRNARGDYELFGDDDWGDGDKLMRDLAALRRFLDAQEEEKRKYAEMYFKRGDGFLQFTGLHLQSIGEVFQSDEAGNPSWVRPDRVIVPYQRGQHTVIEPHKISYGGGAPSDEQIRATMQYIAKHWNGECYFQPSAGVKGSNSRAVREYRLKFLAYTEVYGIKFTDMNNEIPKMALTQKELAKLPELCREIRAAHPDAPPARPANSGVRHSTFEAA